MWTASRIVPIGSNPGAPVGGAVQVYLSHIHSQGINVCFGSKFAGVFRVGEVQFGGHLCKFAANSGKGFSSASTAVLCL